MITPRRLHTPPGGVPLPPKKTTMETPEGNIGHQEAIKELPYMKDINVRYLYEPDGKPTELTKMLIGLGCHILMISPESEEKTIVNDEPDLTALIHDVVTNYMYHYDHIDDNDVDHRRAEQAIADEKSFYYDKNDFYTDKDVLRPLSLREMENFFAQISMIRRINGHWKKLLYNNDPKIDKLKNRIVELYHRMAAIMVSMSKKTFTQAQKSTEEEISSFTARRKQRKEARLGSVLSHTDAERYEDIFQNKNFDECAHILTSRYGFKKDAIIDNVLITELFAEIRALVRHLNHYIGMNTITETQSYIAQQIEEATKKNLSSEPYRISAPASNDDDLSQAA